MHEISVETEVRFFSSKCFCIGPRCSRAHVLVIVTRVGVVVAGTGGHAGETYTQGQTVGNRVWFPRHRLQRSKNLLVCSLEAQFGRAVTHVPRDERRTALRRFECAVCLHNVVCIDVLQRDLIRTRLLSFGETRQRNTEVRGNTLLHLRRGDRHRGCGICLRR